MKVFLSWSGENSKKVAVIFQKYLKMIIQGSEPFVSSEDIEKGAKGLEVILENLKQSNFGLIIMTSDNINRPWLYFEADVISKQFDGMQANKVSAFLFDITGSEVKGSNPLMSIFQYTENKKDDLLKLFKSINASMGDKRIENNILEDLFNMTYDKMDDELNAIKTPEKEYSEGEFEEQASNSLEDSINELVNQNREIFRIIANIDNSYDKIIRRKVEYKDLSIQQRAFFKGLIGISEEMESGEVKSKFRFHLREFIKSITEEKKDSHSELPIFEPISKSNELDDFPDVEDLPF